MDWDDLRIFAELARSGSLSAAARRLKLDHTTVGRRIAALEAALGLKLFDRLAHGTTLTADGERIAAAAQAMEDQAFAVLRLAQGGEGAGGALSGTVRISAPPTVAAVILAPRLAALRSRHPGLTVELMGETRATNLSRREADIALRLDRPDAPSLVARRIGGMAYRLYGTAAYLADTPRERWEYVGYDDALDHIPQQIWLRRLAGSRGLAIRSNDLAVQLAAVKAGAGLAVLPCFMAGSDAGLTAVDVPQPPAPRDIWLAVHADLRQSPRIRTVMDVLVEAIESARKRLDGA